MHLQTGRIESIPFSRNAGTCGSSWSCGDIIRGSRGEDGYGHPPEGPFGAPDRPIDGSGDPCICTSVAIHYDCHHSGDTPGDHQDVPDHPGMRAEASRLLHPPYGPALLVRDGQVFFDAVELPHPKYNLDVGSGTHAVQTGAIMAGTEKVLGEEQPDIVLVQGDTNTVLAGALAAAKLHIKVGHVEAGLRSLRPDDARGDQPGRRRPHLRLPLCADRARPAEPREGRDPGERRSRSPGTRSSTPSTRTSRSPETEEHPPGPRAQPEGVHPRDGPPAGERRRPGHLAGIIAGLEEGPKFSGLPLIYPVHPRAEKMIAEFGIDTDGLAMIKPVGFLEFLQLESQARLVLTDSGGVQEETCILGVPCVTLRENTERPETVQVRANVLVGTNPHDICQGAAMMMDAEPDWENPFGDG